VTRASNSACFCARRAIWISGSEERRERAICAPPERPTSHLDQHAGHLAVSRRFGRGPEGLDHDTGNVTDEATRPPFVTFRRRRFSRGPRAHPSRSRRVAKRAACTHGWRTRGPSRAARASGRGRPGRGADSCSHTSAVRVPRERDMSAP
jgi:hypothetical protein